jgi:hypothetical protein
MTQSESKSKGANHQVAGRATGYRSAFGVREDVGNFSEVVMFRRVLRHIRRRSGGFVAPFFALEGGAMAANTDIASTDAIPSRDLAGSSYGSPVIASRALTTGAWRLSLRALVITAIVVAAFAIAASGASAAGPVKFLCTGAEQTYSVPAGVTALNVKAVGAPGAPGANSKPGSGGLGALVSATVPLPPGTSTAYVEVGCAGSVGTGGFNGGGGSTGGSTGGGGGGGASDVRLDPMSTGLTPTDSRLVVAGGGGGGGTCSDPGGTAGDRSITGAGMGGQGDDTECGVFGLGIAPGIAWNGGFGGTAGGIGGFGTLLNPCTGGSGSLGQGGPGCNNGGGGGGGYWGGGGGGDGNRAGGNGAAGSSFWVPDARATSMNFNKRNLQPEVLISPAH